MVAWLYIRWTCYDVQKKTQDAGTCIGVSWECSFNTIISQNITQTAIYTMEIQYLPVSGIIWVWLYYDLGRHLLILSKCYYDTQTTLPKKTLLHLDIFTHIQSFHLHHTKTYSVTISLSIKILTHGRSDVNNIRHFFDSSPSNLQKEEIKNQKKSENYLLFVLELIWTK